MCLFDCKCKSLKRLGENIKNNRKKHKQTEQLKEKHKQKNRNTGYPAHEPPRINRTNYSRRFVGWISCISVVFPVFLWVFLFVCLFMFLLCFRLVLLSFCVYNRKNTYKNRKHRTTQRKTEKHKKTEISQPEPERYLFAVGSRAGYPVFLLCFLFFFQLFNVLFNAYFCFFFFMFSPSLFKLLHLQSKKHIYK